MSSTKVKRINSTILDAASTWAANALTVVTTANHNLVTGDVVSLMVQNSPQELINATVTVTNATTFTVPAPAWWQDTQVPVPTLNTKVIIGFFRNPQTGRFTFSAPRNGGGAAAVVQSFVIGTGGASYTLDGSLDGVHWTNIATVTHAAVTNDTQSAQIAPMWAYLSINITALGAATQLFVNYSA